MKYEEAIDLLQQDVVRAEAERDEAQALLLEIEKHTRLTDKNAMRFTSTFPEEVYDRFHKYMVRLRKTRGGK